VNLTRVAAKQLTASDLTLFYPQFHKAGQRSKQKAINLNADVFVAQFYPGLRDQFAELHFGLTIVGPGAAPAYTVSRKALRTQGAKNWRLNGELIGNPPDEPDRFDALSEGDIAILAFEGTQQPQQVLMVVLSADDDAALHAATAAAAQFEGRTTMRAIDEATLRQLMATTRDEYSGVHPLEPLLAADSVEDALYGSPESQETTVSGDGRGIAVSPESVRRQAMLAGETGQAGEEAFEQWLLFAGHDEDDFDWVSQSHGRAVFDFVIARPRWEVVSTPLYVDVKATRGPHSAPFHMSAAELRWAAQNPTYRIARVSELTQESASIKILDGVHTLASRIIEELRSLPNGVKVDSVEIASALLREVYGDTVAWPAEE
jgi:hypothetical protein